ncbi:MAG: 50S ribosomal protein L10, partial [Bacteroidales bacterium]|nr:50S ribosomal protein L10 [Bacteroidales bacterium]
MKKELKDQVIESISAQLKEYPHFYVTDISGLNAEDTVKLRRSCFEQGIKLTVVKNTLFAHVLK